MMIISILLILAFCLRLINLNQSFWLDEAAQVIESIRPLNQQLDISSDFHPPLYHLILHFWLKFGQSEIYARFPSIIFGLGSIYIIYKIAETLRFKSKAYLAALLLSISPFHIYYSQETRPYMFFVFLGMLSTFYWLKSKTASYLITNIFLLYTNYFASFLIFGQLFTTVILRKKFLKTQLKSILLTYCFFIPWIPSFISQLMIGLGGAFSGWTKVVSEEPIRNIPLTFAKFILGKASFDNNLVYALILLPSIVWFTLSCYLMRKIENGKLLLSLFFSSFGIAFILSFLIPVIAPQRLIFLLPVFILIITAPLAYYKNKIYIIGYSFVLLTSVLGLFLYIKEPRFQRENWRESVNWLKNSAPENHIVLFSFPEPFAPFLWYNTSAELLGKGIAPGFKVGNSDIEAIKTEIKNKDRVYYYSYLSDLIDPEKKVNQTIEKSGFKVETIQNFEGVGFVYAYEKKDF